MSAQLSPAPLFKSWTNNGLPNANGWMYSYVAGTTTPQATYIDYLQITQNTNPIVFNARGEANVWLNPALTYKLVQFDQYGNQLLSTDQVPGGFIQASSTGYVTDASLSPTSQIYAIDQSYDRTPAEIAAGVTPVNYGYNSSPIDPRRYGYAVGGSTATNNTALANLILVLRQSGGVVQFPPGQAAFSASLNFTNFGSTPVVLKGSGFDANYTAGTTLLGQTGRQWMADFTGSQNITIEEMNWYGNGGSPSTLGLLFARSASNQFAQQVRLIKSVVSVPTDAGASSIGSIPVANICAEQFVTDHCSFSGDSGYHTSENNDLSLTSAYSTIYVTGPANSNTVQQHRQTTFNALVNSAISAYGLADSSFYDCVYARQGGSTSYAIVLNDSPAAGYKQNQNLFFGGQVEGFPGGVTFNTASGAAYNVRTRLFMVAPSVSAYVAAANSYALYNCVFNNNHTANLNPNVAAISFGTGNQIFGGEIYVYPGMANPPVGGTTPVPMYARINYAGNGTSVQALALPTHVTSLGSPNGSNSYIDGDGYIYLAGTLVADGTGITAGSTVATIASVHRPNRTLIVPCQLGGVGATYMTITSAGVITLPSNFVSVQLSLEGVSFRQTN